MREVGPMQLSHRTCRLMSSLVEQVYIGVLASNRANMRSSYMINCRMKLVFNSFGRKIPEGLETFGKVKRSFFYFL